MGKKPVPPDLWLIDHAGNHRFIEVKLPREKIREHQLAGLAVIATCLSAATTISVEIIELYSDPHKDPRKSPRALSKREAAMRKFNEFCGAPNAG